ncbi:MAG: hypothetical protein JWN32_2580 [Solirubrobacterales bacterium]|nr:hypothetical protein [Solirubrobacterales bacterium]
MMRLFERAPRAMAVWGVYLIALGAVLWFVFFADALSFALPAAAAGITFAVAVLSLRPERRREELEHVTDLSPGTPLAALGFACALVGLEVGEWLVLIGAGLLGLALGILVVRERPG